MPGPTPPPRPSRRIEDLIALMAALRDPTTGCPWDIEQTFASISRYTVEEAYEVADAIARDDLMDLRDELGDLLLQVVFHARMAEERQAFAFGDVVEAITTKLIRRHPHVFGEARDLSPDEVKRLWDTIKAEEKRERAASGRPVDAARPSALDGVPIAMPAMLRAEKLSTKAAVVGFTWAEPVEVIDKVREELDEVAEIVECGDRAAIADEIGDVLFSVVNLARLAGIDPEAALAGANGKFERRFKAMEDALAAEGRRPQDATLDEMEDLWRAAKAVERAIS